jgi:hypothetical protein
MKKEEERKEKDKNQEDKVSGSELGEFGTEYEFFITDDARAKEESYNGADQKETARRQDDRDQSKTFFLPDFFPHKD